MNRISKIDFSSLRICEDDICGSHLLHQYKPFCGSVGVGLIYSIIKGNGE